MLTVLKEVLILKWVSTYISYFYTYSRYVFSFDEKIIEILLKKRKIPLGKQQFRNLILKRTQPYNNKYFLHFNNKYSFNLLFLLNTSPPPPPLLVFHHRAFAVSISDLSRITMSYIIISE